MTEDEAKAMLARLSEHYGQPVMPIGKYCKALVRWENAWHERAHRAIVAAYPGTGSDDHNERSKACRRFDEDCCARRRVDSAHTISVLCSDAIDAEEDAQAISRVFTKIRKSNLLYRILYADQEVRTEMCPTHKGKWSGCSWGENPCACNDDGNVTGWLPVAAKNNDGST